MKPRALLSTICTVLSLSLIEGQTVRLPVAEPFITANTKRNAIVIISDLHLGADLAYSEINANLKPLATFLDRIRVSTNVAELVIAGDLLDEWFVPATTDTYNGKDQTDFVLRIVSANERVFEALNRLIQERKVLVTYVPGNHDMTITAKNIDRILPGIRQARDEQQGLGTYSPVGNPEIAIEHGHRYNFFCAPDPVSNKDIAPLSILPPGYFFTRIAALHVVQKCKTPVESIPSLTRNITANPSQELAYIYWSGLKYLMQLIPVENRLGEKIIVTNIGGFTGSYAINDFLPRQESPGGLIDVTLFHGIQDTWNERQKINGVTIEVPLIPALTKGDQSGETDAQASAQYFMNGASTKRIVIFGHTHDAKIRATENLTGQKTIYANSGTWIDHNPRYPDTFCSFIVITPQNAGSTSRTGVTLYNFTEKGIQETASESLQL